MSNTINGHIIKYKTESGEWIPIPIFYSDIYTAYCEYCKANEIAPVSQQVYFDTLGNLSTLVKQLTGNADAFKTLAGALNSGTLPTHMGGLGVSISHSPESYILTNAQPDDWGVGVYYIFQDGEYLEADANADWEPDTYYRRIDIDYVGSVEDYLTDTPENGGLDLATKTWANGDATGPLKQAKGYTDTAVSGKINASEFNSGTAAPTSSTSGKYYFQY